MKVGASVALSEIERKILVKLSALDKDVHPFIFYRELQLSPFQISDAIKRLENQHLVTLNELLVRITEQGQRLIFRMRGGQLASKERPWQECPERFRAPQIGVDALYIPRLSLLDKSFRIKRASAS